MMAGRRYVAFAPPQINACALRQACSWPGDPSEAQVRYARCRLAFGTRFYCDYGVSAAPDDVTSLSAIGGNAHHGPAAFTTTHWSVVLNAQGESPAAQEALEILCRTYWRPMYGFVRRHGLGREEAQDLVQEFFARLLEHRNLETVRREKGRLRSYLLVSLKYFLASERHRASGVKL